LVYCQNERLSEHEISFNINREQKKIRSSKIYVIVENDTIKGKEINNKYYFPYIENEFTIVIEINKTIFEAGPFKPMVLNSDCDLDLGIINSIKKITSVAEYNRMNEKDEGWEWYSKRYFIVNNIYTIDIKNPNKLKKLTYLVLNGKTKSSEKIVETKIISQKEITKT
jgi:hypothetical protein